MNLHVLNYHHHNYTLNTLDNAVKLIDTANVSDQSSTILVFFFFLCIVLACTTRGA